MLSAKCTGEPPPAKAFFYGRIEIKPCGSVDVQEKEHSLKVRTLLSNYVINLQESQDLAFLRLEHSPDLEHNVRPTGNQIWFYDVDLPEFAPLLGDGQSWPNPGTAVFQIPL